MGTRKRSTFTAADGIPGEAPVRSARGAVRGWIGAACRDAAIRAVLGLLLAGSPAAGQAGPAAEPEAAELLEVSGLLVEEAYTQEAGVVQSVATWLDGAEPGATGWSLGLAQEWPVGGERHQVEFEVDIRGGGEAPGLAGAELSYRRLLVGGEDAFLTFAPGVGVGLERELEDGEMETAPELEVLAPLALRFHPRLSTHTLLGVALSSLEGEGEGEGLAVAPSFGQSVVVRFPAGFNLLAEALWTGAEEWDEAPWRFVGGVQVGLEVAGEVEVVPGAAVVWRPEVGEGEMALLLYLSIEHGFPGLPGGDR